MGMTGTIILILGLVGLLESLIILIFPHWSINFGKKWMKNPKTLKKAALIELIFAIILILIGMNV